MSDQAPPSEHDQLVWLAAEVDRLRAELQSADYGKLEIALAELAECRADRDEWFTRAGTAMKELQERNEDLKYWRPRFIEMRECLQEAQETLWAIRNGGHPPMSHVLDRIAKLLELLDDEMSEKKEGRQ